MSHDHIISTQQCINKVLAEIPTRSLSENLTFLIV